MAVEWTSIVVAVIAATPPTILALINRGKLHEVHLSLNSRLDELVKASISSGRQLERDSHMITVPGVPEKKGTGITE